MLKLPSIFFVITASLLVIAESTNTLQELIIGQKRFIVYNSRSLSGECLSICKTNTPTPSPTRGVGQTKPPVNSPIVEASTGSPTIRPTRAPTNLPTNFPTSRPTITPTKSPTKIPTSQPTEEAPSHECVWPREKFSAITKGDMTSGAHNVYKKLVVGGKFKNPSNNHISIDGKLYYGESYEGRINFNKGTQKFNDWESIDVDYEHYEWLATHMKTSNSGNYKVVVKTTGKDGSRNGCYDLYDFKNGGQGEDNGNTLVVFNTSDDICLTKTHDGRQFGPSVLAPFSKVTVKDAGFVDGAVVAREFTTVYSGGNGGQLQLHGDLYQGPIECI